MRMSNGQINVALNAVCRIRPFSECVHIQVEVCCWYQLRGKSGAAKDVQIEEIIKKKNMNDFYHRLNRMNAALFWTLDISALIAMIFGKTVDEEM